MEIKQSWFWKKKIDLISELTLEKYKTIDLHNEYRQKVSKKKQPEERQLKKRLAVWHRLPIACWSIITWRIRLWMKRIKMTSINCTNYW